MDFFLMQPSRKKKNLAIHNYGVSIRTCAASASIVSDAGDALTTILPCWKEQSYYGMLQMPFQEPIPNHAFEGFVGFHEVLTISHGSFFTTENMLNRL